MAAQTPRFNVASVLAALKIPAANVLCVYVIGSRSWGTSRDTSDYDFVIVTSGLASSGSGSALHARNINAKLIDRDEYLQRIRAHRLLELSTLWLPVESKWIERLRGAEHFELQRATLSASIDTECAKDWSRIRKMLLEHNDLPGAKKTLVCAIRNCLLALQLLEHGRIVDYTCANEHRHELMHYYETDWQAWDDTYGSLLRDLQRQIRGDA